jgi:hypothetical protein
MSVGLYAFERAFVWQLNLLSQLFVLNTRNFDDCSRGISGMCMMLDMGHDGL